MNKRFRGVPIVTGCMLLAGASVADAADVRDDAQSEGTYVEPDPSKLHGRPPKKDSPKKPRHPQADQVQTNDPLRGRRPQ